MSDLMGRGLVNFLPDDGGLPSPNKDSPVPVLMFSFLSMRFQLKQPNFEILLMCI